MSEMKLDLPPTPEALAEFDGTVLQNPWIPSKPTPKQAMFLLHNDYFEGLFGGSAAGKTEALLMAASQYVDVPGYSALILRESFPALDMPGGLISRSHDWWLGKAHYHEREHRWTFPSGATVSFGYIGSDRDAMQYMAGSFQFIGFDELTLHEEKNYCRLLSRLRNLREGPLARVPLRMRGVSNRGGPGESWVANRFLPDSYFSADRQSRAGRAWYKGNRFFVPCAHQDNPYIDQSVYETAMATLAPEVRAQLFDDTWGVER